MSPTKLQGPLTGVRVVELAGIGPGPHAAMVLADLGADVVRVESRTEGLSLGEQVTDPALRGRRIVTADLKDDDERATVLHLISNADVLLEGFRPGVAERLGVGPQECHARNARLVYARMTGYGQDGPLAARAGHDINYISLTGALHTIGRAGGQPVVPLNLVGDFGGGSMLVVIGILAALREADRSGEGQVVDAAMVDGSSLLMQMTWFMRACKMWTDERESNLLDGGAPFYDTYTCSDGKYVAVGAVEAQFYRALLAGLGISEEGLPGQYDSSGWPIVKARIAGAFATKPRDEWVEVFTGVDACVTPVLTLSEVQEHPHIAERSTVVTRNGITQAAPAPRFSRTPAQLPPEPHETEARDVLTEWREQGR
ncbi:CaiB/BaiF CoA transferase family protein [Streptomyces sp. KL116D]|uniref:CaiB/BaiF CoA transferase family protein n=1 Tax=Streptomyces sp. KL116D TaxID=3045152 RepID=UPI0035587720